MVDKVDGFDYDKFFRANVSVSQYDEFIETYGIKEGDGMYVLLFTAESRTCCAITGHNLWLEMGFAHRSGSHL